MNRRARFLDSAEADFNEIAWWIAEQSRSTEVADAFVDALRERCERFAVLDGSLGTARPELGLDIRSTPYKDYVIFFRYADEVVEIINVLNGRRDIDAYFSDEE